jgi:hypothetical protein
MLTKKIKKGCIFDVIYAQGLVQTVPKNENTIQYETNFRLDFVSLSS